MLNFFYDVINSNKTEDIVPVSKNLYLSNWYTACNVGVLREHNIKEIICLTQKVKSIEVIMLYNRYNIKHYPIHLDSKEDDVKIIEKYAKVYDIIEGKSHNILIHCTAGKSRSCGFFIFYMMKKNLLPLEEAYVKVKEVRPNMSVSDTIIYQLLLFERYKCIPVQQQEQQQKQQQEQHQNGKPAEVEQISKKKKKGKGKRRRKEKENEEVNEKAEVKEKGKEEGEKLDLPKNQNQKIANTSFMDVLGLSIFDND
jgi:protein-tyrosine phosphatase